MPKISVHPSYSDCVALALSRARSPMNMDDLLTAVAEQRPLTKSARSAIYQAMARLFQAVPVGEGRFGWLSSLLRGNTFRHTLSKTELRRGVVYLDELLHGVFAPSFFQEQRTDLRPVTLNLVGYADSLSVPIGLDRKIWALKVGESLASWVDAAGGQPQDDVVIRVDDAEAGRYTLRLQPREMRDDQVLDPRNLEVAQTAEQILAQDRKLRAIMPVWDLAALLIGQGLFQDPTPPDELHLLLAHFSTLQFYPGRGYALADAHHPPVFYDAFGGILDEGLELFLGADPADPFGADDETGGGGRAFPWGDSDLELPDFQEFVEAEMFSDLDDSDNIPCPDYQSYLDVFEDSDPDDTPLGHDEYHLLEAELENLVSLELEFGYLMPDQEARKIQLAERLFIDPDSLFDNFGDDMDTSDMDGPPFWEN